MLLASRCSKKRDGSAPWRGADRVTRVSPVNTRSRQGLPRLLMPDAKKGGGCMTGREQSDRLQCEDHRRHSGVSEVVGPRVRASRSRRRHRRSHGALRLGDPSATSTWTLLPGTCTRHFELLGETGVIQCARFENEIPRVDPKANPLARSIRSRASSTHVREEARPLPGVHPRRGAPGLRRVGRAQDHAGRRNAAKPRVRETPLGTGV